ncbi:TPA: DUF5462 family protein [Yersinia enterocolitica]|nr:DUF5462 family protein [Yersinia enterocolitica]
MRVSVITTMLGMMFFWGSNAVADISNIQEKNHYLGVLNGQVEGNNVVKVNRTLTDSIIYNFSSEKKIPNNLIIKDATIRGGQKGNTFITLKRLLPEQKGDAYITLNVIMLIDGERTPFSFYNRGEDVVINVPSYGKNLQLRSDAPVELNIPVNYRGNIRISMEIEDEYVDN